MNDKSQSMLAIRYRDFYDVPRMFVVEHSGNLYLFDAPFNDQDKKYQDTYMIYIVPGTLRTKFDDARWAGLEKECQQVGSIQVKDVSFDPSLRQAVNVACFAKVF